METTENKTETREDGAVVNHEDEKALLTGIDPRYFKEDFDAMAEFWANMPEDPDSDYLQSNAKKYEQQLNIVSGELSRKVMENYDAFVTVMERIEMLSMELRLSKEMCREARTGIKSAKGHMSMGGLQVINLYERREQHLNIAQKLQDIKKIRNIKKSLQEKIKEGDFGKALSLCHECAPLIKKYSDFNCIKNMDIKTEYELVKSKLDETLSQACRYPFNSELYKRTIDAFQLIRKPSRVLTRLNGHFSSNISVVAMNTILSHVLTNLDDYQQAEEIKKLTFTGLCKKLNEEQFIPSARMVLEQMVDIMFAHQDIVNWHKSQENSKDATSSTFYKEIGTGIDQNKKPMWDEMQRTISSMCTSSRLYSFKMEVFLSFLENLNYFVEIGEDFSGESAHKLRGVIKQLSKSYYDLFHQSKVDDLRSMLENEMWSKCPVQPKFSVKDISEISTVLSDRFIQTTTISTGVAEEPQKTALFSQCLKEGNPFSASSSYLLTGQKLNELQPSQSSSSTSSFKRSNVGEKLQEEDPDLTVQYVDEFDGKRKGNNIPDPSISNGDDGYSGPLLTSTTIKLVRHIGKYIGMMKTLSNVSSDICQGIFQILTLYVYTVFTFFGPSLTIAGLRVSSATKASLTQMPTRLTTKTHDGKVIKLMQGLKLNEKVNVNATVLYGLMHRCIAAESLIFVQSALNTVRPVLHKMLPKSFLTQLASLYTTNIDTLPEIRTLLYKELCQKLVPGENLIKVVQEVNWNMTDIPMRHSQYVDVISTLLEGFKKRLQTLNKSSIQIPPPPPQIQSVMWDSMISHVFDCLVEGYAAERCSNEGRAMMGIDFGNVTHTIEKTTGLHPVPHVKFVEAYIKSFYLTDADLEKWIVDHKEYTNKQLVCLVTSGSWDINVKRRCLRYLNTNKE
eukprot:TRINITY_DN7087_c0_g1_i2.p1 TRINITY_DN7087_c0_g1~~TRINITY_DN7087_c0_g1_i2.p1  ORF type:complete len:903 (-),score=201.13 TRINITY_DN7087_c0_g1_i2:6-2714(-)